jgi:hypothetical protein
MPDIPRRTVPDILRPVLRPVVVADAVETAFSLAVVR